jgi:pseudaminic acid cytidylyltransferase
MNKSKPICIIPARGGSKRIPKKNLLVYRNKSLLQIAIEKALGSNLFESVIVNTDDSDVIQDLKTIDGVIVSTRPKNLGGDNVRADEVIRWEISKRKIDFDTIVCCLFATTPGLEIEQIEQALDHLPLNSAIFGVTKSSESIYRTFLLDSKNTLTPVFKEKLESQSQDYPDTYLDAGAFYIARATTWESNYSITQTNFSKGWILDRNLNIDINSWDDWNLFKLLNPE